jgi:diguanylate cyclase (GGDEF)-like protein
MHEDANRVERLGPQARLQDELTKLKGQNREVWILIVFAAAVLLLGAMSLLWPSSFWQQGTLEFKIPPQVLFIVMMVVMVLALWMVRQELEVRKLRMANMQQQLEAQSDLSASMVDSLTNVFSRSFLRELLHSEISRAERNKRPLGLVMCDVDNFKAVNDRFGHLMGDYVLAQIASILKACVRGSDYVIRYGGDEFLVILSETDEPGAKIVLNRIREKVSDWDRTNRIGDLSVTVSMGHHQYAVGETPEQAVSKADAAMYQDKERGQRATPAARGVASRPAG